MMILNNKWHHIIKFGAVINTQSAVNRRQCKILALTVVGKVKNSLQQQSHRNLYIVTYIIMLE